MSTLEELEKMEALGFKVVGDTFKETFTYFQIQRKKEELKDDKGSNSR